LTSEHTHSGDSDADVRPVMCQAGSDAPCLSMSQLSFPALARARCTTGFLAAPVACGGRQRVAPARERWMHVEDDQLTRSAGRQDHQERFIRVWAIVKSGLMLAELWLRAGNHEGPAIGMRALLVAGDCAAGVLTGRRR